ncbi:MAG: hypothetical protein WBP34_08000 [Thermoanaerobaculia bacterium]
MLEAVTRTARCTTDRIRRIRQLSEQTASYIRARLAGIGVLEELKVGREKIFVNIRLMRLLTQEDPGPLEFP